MKKKIITLELEGLPPTVNHMYKNSNGRRFKTKECRDYQGEISTELKFLWGKPPYKGRVALNVKLITANRRRWDLDNRLKALQDCLQLAGVIKDDSQIDCIFIERQYAKKNATILTLFAIEG